MGNYSTSSFAGQVVYIGIDVHKNSWHVTEVCAGAVVHMSQMPPSAQKLAEHLRGKYPDAAQFRSVYEAGCCGFHIHHELEAQGIRNIVVNPADVPTNGKERQGKNDSVDSRKLALTLCAGLLCPIYIPAADQLRFRDLVRRESQVVHDVTRAKNRIKSHLLLQGSGLSSWGRRELANLSARATASGDVALRLKIDSLNSLKAERKSVISSETDMLAALNRLELFNHLKSSPGIGRGVALTLISELWDMKRFRTREALCSYAGVAPSLYGSGEHQTTRGAGARKNDLMHRQLVEAAWNAIMHDANLHKVYDAQKRKTGGCPQKAICVVARKLLLIARAIWLSGTDYRKSEPAQDAAQGDTGGKKQAQASAIHT